MVVNLVQQLLERSEVSRVLVTLNVPEVLSFPDDSRIQLIYNDEPLGFGANHNAAFQHGKSPYFCVLNPDIELKLNPFAALLADLQEDGVGLCAPLVTDENSVVEDSARRFLTPWRMVLRKAGLFNGAYRVVLGGGQIYPDWIAGMFMLFDAEAFRKVGGFDTAYFMYCEDADICTRLWQSGYQVVLDSGVSVVHRAQRASRRSATHLRWHIGSMVRYFFRYWGRLPRTAPPL